MVEVKYGHFCTSWLTILLSLTTTNKLSLSLFRSHKSRSYYYAVEVGQQMSYCTVCQKVVESGGGDRKDHMQYK